MIHQWMELERGIWAALDGHEIADSVQRQYRVGHMIGRAIVELMTKRAAYVPPEEDPNGKYTSEIRRLRTAIKREQARTVKVRKALDATLADLAATRRRMGRVVDADPAGCEVRP